MAETFNQELFEAMLRHQTGILRFSGGVRNQIWRLLDATEADLAATILAQAGGAGFTTSKQRLKLEKLLASLSETRLGGWKDANKVWFEEMHGLAQAEPGFFDNLIAGAVPVELGSTLPSVEVLKDIVTSTPFQGKTLSEWATNIQAADIGRIEDAVKIGLVQGESPSVIARRIVGSAALNGRDGVTQITRRHAASITRTVTSGIASEARAKYAELNKDLAPDELFTATLDSRTTPICRRFDGQIFKVGTGPVFPLHFGERSLYSPIIDGEVVGERPRRDFTERQLLREFSKEKGFKAPTKRAKLPRGTKGEYDVFARKRMRELTGTAPAKLTYQKWLEGQTAEFQDDILGPTRGKAFRNGLKLDRFVQVDGTELTLAQLAKLNAEAFKGIKLPIVGGTSQKIVKTAASKLKASVAAPPGKPRATKKKTATKVAPTATAETLRDELAEIIGADPIAVELMPAEFMQEIVDVFKESVPTSVARSLRQIRFLDLGTDAYAQVEGLGTILTFNRKMFGDARALKRASRALKLDFNAKWSSTATTKGVVSHEMGHVLDSFKTRSFVSPFADATEYVFSNPATIANLSEYALTNVDEAFAEAFSAVFEIPKTKWNPWLQGFAEELRKGYVVAGDSIPSILK